MKAKIFIYSVLLLILSTSCHQKKNLLISKENKLGGIYEADENRKEFVFFDRDSIVKLNTDTYISFQEFENLLYGKDDFEIDTFYIVMTEDGTKKLSQLSQKNINKSLYFVVDTKIAASPVLIQPIESGNMAMSLSNEKINNYILDYFNK